MSTMAGRSELGISPVLLQAIAQTLTSSGSTSTLPSTRESLTTAAPLRDNNSQIVSSEVNTNSVSVLSSHSDSQLPQDCLDSGDSFSTRFIFKRNMDGSNANEGHSGGGVVSHLLQNLNEPVAPLMPQTHTSMPSSVASSYDQQLSLNENRAVLTEAGLSMLGIPATTASQASIGSGGSSFEDLGFSDSPKVSAAQAYQQETSTANMSNDDMTNFLLKQERSEHKFINESVMQQQETSTAGDTSQHMNSVSNMLSAIASQHAQKNSPSNQRQQENNQENIQQLTEDHSASSPVTLAAASISATATTTTSTNKPIIIYSYINNEGQEITMPVSTTGTQIVLNNGGRITSMSDTGQTAVKNLGTGTSSATYRVVLQPQGTGVTGNPGGGLKQSQAGTVTLDLNCGQAASGTRSNNAGIASVSTSLSMVVPVTDAQNTQDGMNQPCPVCGDKVSGYHYGIFTCESCKGFFKRTVQNNKNFVCPKSGDCTITSQNRKKCPACRFKRCLDMGMKLEAIRKDRTRGGRSSYDGCQTHFKPRVSPLEKKIRRVTGCLPGEEEPEPTTSQEDDGSASHSNLVAILNHGTHKQGSPSAGVPQIPELLRDIMNLEPLLSDDDLPADTITESPFPEQAVYSYMMQLAELRLYKLVRWARNLPQFGAISTDDQILLLQNCWSELMALSLCWRSIDTPNQISISSSHHITAAWAHHLGFEDVVIQLINITDCFRKLFMDQFEYVALKVLLLITPDVKGLKEPRKIRDFQDKLLEALLAYTTSHYKNLRHKFGELLLRLPELSRISFMSKDILIKSLPPSMASCGLLVELLKGDNKGEGDSQGGLRF